MNTLSWLIYFADITPGIIRLSIGIGFLSLFALGINLMSLWETGDIQRSKDKRDILEKRIRKLLLLTVASAFVGVFLPSKEGVYWIAASEFGEELTQTDGAKNIGNKSYQALDKFLSDYLEEDNE